jgi:L-iditol 2-dehydrogenase
MRVAMYYGNKDVRIQEQPRPEIGPGEVLLKVLASGICGSDVMEWYRRDKVPLVLGHEVAGVIEAIGEGVTKFAVGDRVAASHHVPCFSCGHCGRGHPTACDTIRSTTFYPGGFAEYVRLPKINVDLGTYLLPAGLDFVEGSFAEPLACVLRGQEKIGIDAGMNVLVIGAGISGLMHVELARALGAGKIVATDLSPFRLEQAERFGADATFLAGDFTPAKFAAATGGRLADRVIVTAGAEAAIHQGLDAAERGATVLLFAPTDEGVRFSFDVNRFFWRNDRTITTTYAGEPADHVHALDLIAAGRFRAREMVTHVLPLAEIQRGFDLVAAGDASLKVVIEPHAG